MGMGILLEVMKMFWNWIVVMIAQLCEYPKNTELYVLKGSILWDVNYISIKLLLKEKDKGIPQLFSINALRMSDSAESVVFNLYF